MTVNLSLIVKESLAVQSADFVKIVERTSDLLRGESGKIGNLNVSERLVKLEPLGEAVVIGDLHGDLESLVSILESSGFTQKMARRKDAILIFLGDYGDRGAYSAEVYYAVLTLKLAFPEQIVLLRGNHEGPEDLLASPHDLPMQFQFRFKEKWKTAYSKIRELFAYLYNAVLVEERYLMVHGGLSPSINSIQDLAHANMTHPEQEFLEDLLWSDPNDMVKDVLHSPRGAGKLFGKKVTENALKKMNAKILIRGHEPCEEGFKINHDGKVLTLFSRKGSPYFNEYGAYLRLPLSEKFEGATQLLPWIRKF
ncbi:MAG TPA: metallophosphoesterase family protein, partial [Acidobacteriota bacterium]|nr:metallophosphoesterase family protein [Acidobacteriota bacterium]